MYAFVTFRSSEATDLFLRAYKYPVASTIFNLFSRNQILDEDD